MAKLAALISGFVVMFFTNALFHVVLAADLFDREVGSILATPIRETNPALPAFIHFLNVSAIVFLYSRSAEHRRTPMDGAILGALLGFIADGSWNLINLTFFPNWSLKLMAIDTAWHTAIGVLSGGVVALTYNWVERRQGSRVAAR